MSTSHKRKQALPVRLRIQSQQGECGDSGMVPREEQPENVVLEHNPVALGLRLTLQDLPKNFKGAAKRLQEIIATAEKLALANKDDDDEGYDLSTESQIEQYCKRFRETRPSFHRQLEEVAEELKYVNPRETFNLPPEIDEICNAKTRKEKGKKDQEVPEEGEREEEAASSGPGLPSKVFSEALLTYDLPEEKNLVKLMPVATPVNEPDV